MKTESIKICDNWIGERAAKADVEIHCTENLGQKKGFSVLSIQLEKLEKAN